jgi:DNA-binding NtrC family response regulator
MEDRVLVVDDEETSRNGLKALISSWGYDVEEATNGKEALDRALVFRPALVITDLVMPGLDGLELLKALRSELPSTAVILVSGHASIETAVVAMREGAYDYVTKPVDTCRLRILIEKALEKADVVREVTLLRRQLSSPSSVPSTRRGS